MKQGYLQKSVTNLCMATKEKPAPKGMGSAIDAAIRDIRTKFGDEAIQKLGDAPKVDVDVIPSGSIGLDWAL